MLLPTYQLGASIANLPAFSTWIRFYLDLESLKKIDMQTATDRISSGLTLRVVVIGLIILFFNFRWMIEVEAMRESPRAYFIYIVPLVNVVFILFVFSLLNLLNGKFAPS